MNFEITDRLQALGLIAIFDFPKRRRLRPWPSLSRSRSRRRRCRRRRRRRRRLNKEANLSVYK